MGARSCCHRQSPACRLVLPSSQSFTWAGSGCTPGSSPDIIFSFVGKHFFVFCFFPFSPPPWPCVFQCLLLASSTRASERIGTSPFPSWECTGLSSHLLYCFRHPFPHLLQHLCVFPELHVVFLDDIWDLGQGKIGFCSCF